MTDNNVHLQSAGGQRNMSDKELAAQYRDEMTRALAPVVEILDRAKVNGLIVGFNIKQDPVGRNVIDFIQVIRHY